MRSSNCSRRIDRTLTGVLIHTTSTNKKRPPKRVTVRCLVEAAGAAYVPVGYPAIGPCGSVLYSDPGREVQNRSGRYCRTCGVSIHFQWNELSWHRAQHLIRNAFPLLEDRSRDRHVHEVPNGWNIANLLRGTRQKSVNSALFAL